jgi:hypothetical protein
LNSCSIPNVPIQSNEGPPRSPTIYVIELELGRLLAWRVNLFSGMFVLDFLKKKSFFLKKKNSFYNFDSVFIDFLKIIFNFKMKSI